MKILKRSRYNKMNKKEIWGVFERGDFMSLSLGKGEQ